MRKWLVGALVLTALSWAGRAAAHEGHAHKVIGTVAVIDVSHLEVKTQDGKQESYSLTPETKYLKGTVSAALADVKVGTRVVLSIVEKDEKKTVAEVLMASGENPGATHEHQH